jgi:hypothetical protein
MSDLIERLEEQAAYVGSTGAKHSASLLREAAARIKKLEEAAKSPLPEEVARLTAVAQGAARAEPDQAEKEIWRQIADALERQARELHEADNSHAKTLVEFGKLRIRIAELEAERDKLGDENMNAQMAHGALEAIHELLDSGGIPRGTFADDHVRNLVAMYNNLKAERDQFMEQAALRDQRDIDMQEIMRINNSLVAERAAIESANDRLRKALTRFIAMFPNTMGDQSAMGEALLAAHGTLSVNGEAIRALAKPAEKEEK